MPRWKSSHAGRRVSSTNAHSARQINGTGALDIRSEALWAAAPLFWQCSADGGGMRFDETWHEFVGADPQSFNSKEWMKWIHSDDRDAIVQGWRRTVSTGRRFTYDFRLMHRSGVYRWVTARGQPTFDEKGHVDGWVGSAIDIDDRKKAELRLAANVERFRAIYEAASMVLWVASPEGEVLEQWGWDAFSAQRGDEFRGWGWLDVVHPDDRLRIKDVWKSALVSACTYLGVFRVLSRQDEFRWVEARALPVRNESGVVREWVGKLTDIHDRLLEQEALQASAETLRLAVESTSLGIWDVDFVTGKREWNAEARAILGLPPGVEVDRETFRARVHPEDLEEVERRFFNEVPANGSVRPGEYRIFRADTGEERWVAATGRTFVDEGGRLLRKLGTVRDITAQKQAEVTAWRMARTDSLTSLSNRAALQEALEKACSQATALGASFNLILVDLDHFKDVNDTLGHDAGDQLLMEVARRLVRVVGSEGLVARFGGDEFAVVAQARSERSMGDRLARRIWTSLAKPMTIGGRTCATKGSIGVATFPEDGASASELLKSADIALYRAKADGRNRFLHYTPTQRAAVEGRIALAEDLRRGLKAKEFEPYYQPKVSLRTGQVVGFEALVRWNHPTRGLLTPGAFDVAFDDPELSRLLGEQVLAKVALQTRQWLDIGVSVGQIAVNVSSAEFYDRNIAAAVLGTLGKYRIDPSLIEVEITESVLLDDRGAQALAALKELSAAGISLALDDFGTGYASLSHLKRFPVKHIKIDKGFIDQIENDNTNEAIALAIIHLGHRLNMIITAEGVETMSQAARLHELGCDNFQGFLCATAMKADRIPDFLKVHKAVVMP